MYQEQLLRGLIQNSELGYWEINGEYVGWSSGFLKITGYDIEDIELNLNYFLYTLLNKDQRDLFRDNYFNLLNDDQDFEQTITLTCKNGQLQELKCQSSSTFPVTKKYPNSKILTFSPVKMALNNRVKNDNFYYRETAEMTSSGSWYVDLVKKKTYWDHECRRILEYPEDYIPSLRYASQYIPEEFYDISYNLFYNCTMRGKSFSTEIKMLTANNRSFWVRAIGKPVYNDYNDMVGIRGVFQDIDDIKIKELDLKNTAEIISSQNKRLFNFAHIVSHNLRSHTSNLSLIMQLMDETNDEDEKKDLIASIKDVSESLNETIQHLNEVVTIQTRTDHNKIEVSFQDSLDRVLKSIISLIVKNDVTIHADFQKVKVINYIPAYLDSIFLNLITNAIKYGQKNRAVIIAIRTYTKDNRIFLEISDNGMGIDLKKHGHKLFEMYKTFHQNKDAVGIGLFITKNQIESLNGEIFVESGIQQGTTFTIKL